MTPEANDRRRGFDEDGVRALEAEYDRAWGNADLDALVRCLAPDAVLVNPRGEVACGLDENERLGADHQGDDSYPLLWAGHGLLLVRQGESDGGLAEVHAAADEARRRGQVIALCACLEQLGEALVRAGRHVEARGAATEAVALARAHGVVPALVRGLDVLAVVQQRIGDEVTARALIAESDDLRAASGIARPPALVNLLA